MATLIEKAYQLDSQFESIKFQILLKSFVNKNLRFSDNEMNVLTLFYIEGVSEITIAKALELSFFKNTQTVKNFISKLTKLGVFKKIKKKERSINNEILDIVVDDIVLMNLKIGNTKV